MPKYKFITADGHEFEQDMPYKLPTFQFIVSDGQKHLGYRTYAADKFRDGEYREVIEAPKERYITDYIDEFNVYLNKLGVGSNVEIIVENQKIVDLIGTRLLKKDYTPGSKNIRMSHFNSYSTNITTTPKATSKKRKAPEGSLRDVIELKLKEMKFLK